MKNRWLTPLVEEAKRQKGKTGVLVAIFVVAIVMWVPILCSWIGGEDDEPFNSRVATAPRKPTTRQKSANWTSTLESRQGIYQQPYRDDGQLLPDPFAVVIESTPAKPAPEPVPKKRVTPKDAGLLLNSTLKVGLVSAARINNELQQQGDEIVIDGKPTGFWLTDIARGHVVVRHDGHFHRLEVPKKERKTLVIQKVTATRH